MSKLYVPPQPRHGRKYIDYEHVNRYASLKSEACGDSGYDDDYDRRDGPFTNCYSYSPRLYFVNGQYDISGISHWVHSLKPRAKELYFGLELEFDGNGYDDYEGQAEMFNMGYPWTYFKSDGSLAEPGFEMCTSPMLWPYGFASMKKTIQSVCNDAKDYGLVNGERHNSAGMHVHISRTFFEQFDDDEKTRIFTRMHKMVYGLPTLTWKISGRNLSDLAEWGSIFSEGLEELASKCQSGQGRSRFGLNFCKEHTIECRIFKGFRNYQSFSCVVQRRLEYLAAMIHYSCGTGQTTEDAFFKYVGRHMTKYPKFFDWIQAYKSKRSSWDKKNWKHESRLIADIVKPDQVMVKKMKQGESYSDSVYHVPVNNPVDYLPRITPYYQTLPSAVTHITDTENEHVCENTLCNHKIEVNEQYATIARYNGGVDMYCKDCRDRYLKDFRTEFFRWNVHESLLRRCEQNADRTYNELRSIHWAMSPVVWARAYEWVCSTTSTPINSDVLESIQNNCTAYDRGELDIYACVEGMLEDIFPFMARGFIASITDEVVNCNSQSRNWNRAVVRWNRKIEEEGSERIDFKAYYLNA